MAPGNTESRGDGVRTTHEHRGTSCLAPILISAVDWRNPPRLNLTWLDSRFLLESDGTKRALTSVGVRETSPWQMPLGELVRLFATAGCFQPRFGGVVDRDFARTMGSLTVKAPRFAERG